MLSIVILTYNSSSSIERTLKSLVILSDDIHIVDSFSTDDTLAICSRYNCQVVQRPFKNYADQRNWAIDNLPLKHPWQMHVDADEELEPESARIIRELDLTRSEFDGYILGRRMVFMGRTLKYGPLALTWHCRLFRVGYGRCEDRLYDQHFVCKGRLKQLRAFMLDHQEQSLSEWTVRHNRWSDMEAHDILQGTGIAQEGQIQAKSLGNVIERKRYAKARYYEFPLFWRAFAYFFYRYFLRLGFLDGREGLIFHSLQAFWFRFLVDAKIFEKLHTNSAGTEK
ncbi:glycosyltransferase family 2 protein [Bradyrhizobium sp. USDA 336]|uniref:glycosyltransferase family 2 protein n=1 Tax=Bradyrhizobium sp. USDA 336 TaxID=3156311 RepID=UPI0038350A35